jgi:hypothetical protein
MNAFVPSSKTNGLNMRLNTSKGRINIIDYLAYKLIGSEAARTFILGITTKDANQPPKSIYHPSEQSHDIA